jgi:chromosome segregation ATPase
MKELVECQGNATREYVEKKLSGFIDVDNFDINELQETIKEIQNIVKSDENSFKLINGLLETNKNKLFTIENTIEEIKGKNKELQDDIAKSNRTSKECLRIVEEDFVLNISELCAVYSNTLNKLSLDEEL